MNSTVYVGQVKLEPSSLRGESEGEEEKQVLHPVPNDCFDIKVSFPPEHMHALGHRVSTWSSFKLPVGASLSHLQKLIEVKDEDVSHTHLILLFYFFF